MPMQRSENKAAVQPTQLKEYEPHGEIRQTAKGMWHWGVLTKEGNLVARSPQPYSDIGEAKRWFMMLFPGLPFREEGSVIP